MAEQRSDHAAMHFRPIAGFQLMNRTLLFAAIQVVLFAGCSRGSLPSPVQSQEQRSGLAWPLLTSDIELGDMEPMAVGEVVLTNPRSDDAKVELVSKSCSCFQISEIPDVLLGNQSACLTFLTAPNPHEPMASVKAVIQLRWPDASTHSVAVDQEVRILPDLQMSPSSLTLESNREKIERELAITLNYRSRRKRRVPKPEALNLPEYASVEIEEEISHPRVVHDIWEVTWKGRLFANSDAVREAADQLDPYQTSWIIWGFPQSSGISSILRVPITVRGTEKRVVLRPNTVYLNASPQSVVLMSVTGKRFRKLSPKDVEMLPFRVELAEKDSSFQRIEISALDDVWHPGKYLCRIQLFAETETEDVDLEVVVPKNRPADYD